MSSSNVTGGSGDRPKEIVICRDLEDLARLASARFVRSAVDAVAHRGRFSVALAGGSTPRRFYQSLAGPPFSEKVPWNGVHLFWTDERAVPPDHPDSNYRMAYETLIAHVPIPRENVHRMQGEMSDLQAAAESYEATLRNFFKPTQSEWPSFDLVLLGIGSDGHTASLFPGSPVLKEEKRWVAALYVEKLKSGRLTLTLPILNHARERVFLAAGKEKAPIVRELLSESPPPTDLPARLIHDGPIFFLDEAAAALIDRKRGDLE